MPIVLRRCRLTAPSSSTPVSAARKNGETPSRFMPLAMSPSVTVPSTAPTHAADAARKLHAAERDRRDGIEAERLPHGRIAGGDAARQIDASDGAGDGAEHVAGDPRRRDADAVERRALQRWRRWRRCAGRTACGTSSTAAAAMATTHQTNAAGTPPTLDFAEATIRPGTTPPAPGMNSRQKPCTKVIDGERHDERMHAEDRDADAVGEADDDTGEHGRPARRARGRAIDRSARW